MTDEQSLLASVCANRDDDAPRLIISDWYEENGQPARAEFIRLQLKIAQMACARSRLYCSPSIARCKCAAVRSRCHKLWNRSWRKWLPRDDPIRTMSLWYLTVRGFVDTIRIYGPSWVKNADTMLLTHPIRHVRLHSWPWIIEPEETLDRYGETTSRLNNRWPGIYFYLLAISTFSHVDGVSDERDIIRRSFPAGTVRRSK
jgi:uncharacterized protein (TIGR02996 family)